MKLLVKITENHEINLLNMNHTDTAIMGMKAALLINLIIVLTAVNSSTVYLIFDKISLKIHKCLRESSNSASVKILSLWKNLLILKPLIWDKIVFLRL